MKNVTVYKIIVNRWDENLSMTAACIIDRTNNFISEDYFFALSCSHSIYSQ